MGTDALLGALFVCPWLRARIGQVRSYWVSVLTNSVLFLVFARMTDIVAGFVVVFQLGISQAVSSVAFGPIFFKATPRAMMGRANSVLMQLLTIVSLLSISVIPLLISGPLHNKFLQIAGALFGPIDTLYMAVAILVITSALYLRVTLIVNLFLIPSNPGSIHHSTWASAIASEVHLQMLFHRLGEKVLKSLFQLAPSHSCSSLSVFGRAMSFLHPMAQA